MPWSSSVYGRMWKSFSLYLYLDGSGGWTGVGVEAISQLVAENADPVLPDGGSETPLMQLNACSWL